MRATNSKNRWLWAEPSTGEQMKDQLALGMKMCPNTKPEDFTCTNCIIKRACILAFDQYNLNGDCLYEK